MYECVEHPIMVNKGILDVHLKSNGMTHQPLLSSPVSV